MTTRGWRSALVQSSTPYAPGCRSFLRVFKKMRRKPRVFACGTHVAPIRKPLFCGHFSVLRENTGRSPRSEEHTSELQSLMRISYAVFCLKTKKTKETTSKGNHRSNTKHPEGETEHR